jgi:hypothetical protein
VQRRWPGLRDAERLWPCRPNDPHTQLSRGQRVTAAERRGGCRATLLDSKGEICSRRDADSRLIARGASAPGQRTAARQLLCEVSPHLLSRPINLDQRYQRAPFQIEAFVMGDDVRRELR